MKLKNSTSLKKLINEHKIILSVYGLGNIGGPIAAAWLRKNANIIVIDYQIIRFTTRNFLFL